MKIVQRMDGMSKPTYVRHLATNHLNNTDGLQLYSQLNLSNCYPNISHEVANAQSLNGHANPIVNLNGQGVIHQIANQIGEQAGNQAGNQIGNQSANQTGKTGKPTIERGASWSYSETKALLSFWGQDMVQRHLTNSKRTRHVWISIADHINKLGYQRTPDQVRTRVFNMIAEYRRIMKQPSKEKIDKCCFFKHLHEIYQAKDASGVRAALGNYEEEFRVDSNSYDENEENMNDNSTTSDVDEAEVFSYSLSPSHCNGVVSQSSSGFLGETSANNRPPYPFDPSKQNLNNLNLNVSLTGNYPNATKPLAFNLNQIGHPNSRTNSVNGDLFDQHLSNDSLPNDASGSKLHNVNGHLNSHLNGALNGALHKDTKQRPEGHQPPAKKHRPNENFNSPADTNLSESLLLERVVKQMCTLFWKDTEVNLEWIKLEQSRLQYEEQRRKDDIAREERREKKLFETVIRIQEMQFAFLSKHIAALKETGHQQLADLKDQIQSRIDKELAANTTPNNAHQSNDGDQPNGNKSVDPSQCVHSTESPSSPMETTNELNQIKPLNSPSRPATSEQRPEIVEQDANLSDANTQLDNEVRYYEQVVDCQNRPSSVIRSSHNTLLARPSIKHSYESSGDLPNEVVDYAISKMEGGERNGGFIFSTTGIHHEEVV